MTMFMSRKKRQEALVRTGPEIRIQQDGKEAAGTLYGAGALALRRPRTPAYVAVLGKLDAGEGKLDPRFLEKVLETIRKDFPEIRCLGQFLGILAVCWIDDSYDVHMLDFQGQVIRHFHKGEPLPEGLEKGRNLALYGGYAFVEVYTDCCRGVFCDGQVAVIPD
ncbi:hypothetical protein [uncultured Acidaminococcus sp.]|uniref:hypothetical protein n=1 Tax=uncultured Acidaminococcus sp. TaxID=352152 RepID=UPI0026DB0C8E|nr:hypothetical protein [uncultured Acidaminococcus sp.]